MSNCTLTNESFVGKVAGDAYLDSNFRCRACARLAAEHPPPAPAAGAAPVWPPLPPVVMNSASADTSGHVSVTGTISPMISSNAVTVSVPPASSTNVIKSSTYFLDLFAKVLKSRRSPYRLIADASCQKVALVKPGHAAIVWLPIQDASAVRDFYICFRLCGDNVFAFVKHFRNISHDEVNEGIDGTPPVSVHYVAKYT